MNLVGYFTRTGDYPIDNASWAWLLASLPELEATGSAHVEHPLTGEVRLVNSPPDLLANIRVGGTVVGLLRAPESRDLVEVAGDAAAVKSTAEHSARHYQSTYKPL